MEELIERFKETDLLVIQDKYYVGINSISKRLGIEYHSLRQRLVKDEQHFTSILAGARIFYELNPKLCALLKLRLAQQTLKDLLKNKSND